MIREPGKMPKLGFGLMRLPQKDEKIDIQQVCEMVDLYMQAGLCYFDTAYVYHGGKSECAAAEALVKRYPRESFYLADKLPAWEMHSEADRGRIFAEQLARAQVEYFDFYLLHSVEDGNIDTYEKYDCFSWGVRMKEEGKIRHFGFSFHGSPDLLKAVLDKHPEIEFVQIQLNYLDWNNPVVRSGELYAILREREIPMVIMEPVKGGTLASLRPEFGERLKAARPEASIASWALRYAGSLPGVMTILSGMSDRSQMEDNIRTFTDFEPLTDGEKKMLEEIREEILNIPQIGCTACRYCVDGCPMQSRIPDIFRSVNTIRMYGDQFRPHAFYRGITKSSGKAADCIACGQCGSVCPQHLPVISLMQEASELLDKE